jgi:hypothetical protein
VARRLERQVRVERELVDAMFARLDSEVADALASRAGVLAAPAEDAQALYARDVEVARLTRVVDELRAADQSLCFGRIDWASGESVHVGRVGLRGADGRPLLVDWRADAARAFYAATPVSPLGLRRRRHLRLNGRKVVDVSDEILDGSSPTAQDVVGDGPLVAALSRARTGRMREVVATLQAEQDAIVRSPHRGVTVVDGGPGTGKTIVALHRAAYVLYAFSNVAEHGVLVVGPNRRFLDYISDVLPSLGENDVRMATTADLVGDEATITESDDAARLKGQARLSADRRSAARTPPGMPRQPATSSARTARSATATPRPRPPDRDASPQPAEPAQRRQRTWSPPSPILVSGPPHPVDDIIPRSSRRSWSKGMTPRVEADTVTRDQGVRGCAGRRRQVAELVRAAQPLVPASGEALARTRRRGADDGADTAREGHRAGP